MVAVGVRDDEEDLARSEGEEIGVAGLPRVALDDDVTSGDAAGAVPVAAGVVEVDEAVRRVVGVDGHRQQAALSAVVHLALFRRDAGVVAQVQHRRFGDGGRAAVPDPDLARLRRDQPVRQAVRRVDEGDRGVTDLDQRREGDGRGERRRRQQ